MHPPLPLGSLHIVAVRQNTSKGGSHEEATLDGDGHSGVGAARLSPQHPSSAHVEAQRFDWFGDVPLTAGARVYTESKGRYTLKQKLNRRRWQGDATEHATARRGRGKAGPGGRTMPTVAKKIDAMGLLSR